MQHLGKYPPSNLLSSHHWSNHLILSGGVCWIFSELLLLLASRHSWSRWHFSLLPRTLGTRRGCPWKPTVFTRVMSQHYQVSAKFIEVVQSATKLPQTIAAQGKLLQTHGFETGAFRHVSTLLERTAVRRWLWSEDGSRRFLHSSGCWLGF